MKFLRGILLLQSSATTNESMSRGGDITTAMKTFFPSIHYADVKALITVCKLILSVKVFNVNLVIQAYPISDFASSTDLQFQTITGDSEFRCAVSPDHPPPVFVFFVQHDLIDSPLAGDHGRKVWPKCYIMGISV